MKCERCGSRELIDDVRMIDRGSYDDDNDLSVKVYTKPGAWLFKGEVSSDLTGRVCGSCGFVELYATNPRALLAADRARSKSSK
jgi:hypothetical protein